MILDILFPAVKSVLSNGPLVSAAAFANLAVSVLLARWLHVTASTVRKIEAERATEKELHMLKLELLQEIKTLRGGND